MSQNIRVGHIDLSFHDAASREVEAKLGADAVTELRKLHLGNARVSELDDATYHGDGR